MSDVGKCTALLEELANMQAKLASEVATKAADRGRVNTFVPRLDFSAGTLRWMADLFRSGDLEPGAVQRKLDKDKAECREVLEGDE